jgi:hypothetical protein
MKKIRGEYAATAPRFLTTQKIAINISKCGRESIRNL